MLVEPGGGPTQVAQIVLAVTLDAAPHLDQA